jgi:hypothetical protein
MVATPGHNNAAVFQGYQTQNIANFLLILRKDDNHFQPGQLRATVCGEICNQHACRSVSLDLVRPVDRVKPCRNITAGLWTPGMVATPGDKNAAFFQKSHTRKTDGMPPNWVWIDNPFHCPTVAITVIWFVLNPHPVGLLLPLFDHFDNKPFCTSFSTSAEPM